MSVNIQFDTSSLSREEAAALATLLSTVGPSLKPKSELDALSLQMYGQTALISPEAASPVDNEHVADSDGGSAQSEPTTVPTRKRGEPSPGKSRRTKAEIAEDEAADANDEPDVRNGEDAMNESAGPQDDAETAAQDAADEAAEVEQHRDPEQPLTVDDLKDVMGDYVNKFTMEATKEDGPKIFVDALGRPPEGEAAWKASLIASMGQDHLRKAIAAWKSAAASDDRYQKKEA